MNNARHPGQYLADEMKTRCLQLEAFADILLTSKSHLTAILRGNKAITAPFALKIAWALDQEAMYWMNLQAEYDLTRYKELHTRKNQIKHRMTAHYAHLVKEEKEFAIITQP